MSDLSRLVQERLSDDVGAALENLRRAGLVEEDAEGRWLMTEFGEEFHKAREAAGIDSLRMPRLTTIYGPSIPSPHRRLTFRTALILVTAHPSIGIEEAEAALEALDGSRFEGQAKAGRALAGADVRWE